MTVVDGVRTSTPEDRVRSGRTAWVEHYLQMLIALDIVCALSAGVTGYGLRFGSDLHAASIYAVLACGLPLLWVPWVAGVGAYDGRFYGAGSEEYRKIFAAGVSLTAAVAITSYATKAEVARGFVMLTLPLLTGLDLVARYYLRKRLHRLRGKGSCMRRVVAIGHRSGVADLILQLGRSTYHGMHVVAVCAPPGKGEAVGGVPVLGTLSEVLPVVRRTGADAIAVLACPELDGVMLRRLAWELEKFDTEIFVAPALLDVAGPRTTIRPIAGLPLLHVDHPKLEGPSRLVKAVLDKAVAAALLMAFSPLMLAVALLIRRTDRGPAFFVQARIGRDGREFNMLKFRTMVVGAEALKQKLLAQNHGDGVLFKLRRDPRITGIGRWLRRYSIDELPQLINVLRGEMSLIGPRPPLPEEVTRYGRDVYRRLVVKPGLTGLWQVSGRSDLPWDEAVRLDLQYIENWSLIMDLQILWKTVAAVVGGSGAY